jgi:hypothetical protein
MDTLLAGIYLRWDGAFINNCQNDNRANVRADALNKTQKNQSIDKKQN